jgi:hypothetical protein
VVVALVEREVVVEATDLRLDEGVVGGQVLAMEWVFPPPRIFLHSMEEGEGEGEEGEEAADVLPDLLHDLFQILLR